MPQVQLNMTEVEYSTENVAKCWCGQCPVQKDSACAKEQLAQAMPIIQSGTMPPPEQMPGLYCASGKASCGDLTATNRCYCPECLVWGEHDLPSNHFCAQGSAKQVAER